MGIYERQRHGLVAAGGVWGDPFRPNIADAMPLPLAAVVPTVTLAATSPAPATPLDVGVEAEGFKFGKRLLPAQQDVVIPSPVEEEEEAPPPSSDSFGGHDDDARPRDKIQRRLAQNREAARKSRLRKKAYIQNLETSRLKLAQLEQELTMAHRRQHQHHQHAPYGAAPPPPPPPPPIDPRIAAFELEYACWLEEQERQSTSLRSALDSDAPDAHLRVLVDAGLAHYASLFQAKAGAARADAFFVLSGVWRAPAERFFLWIGGFRPSDLLNALAPRLDPDLTERQAGEVRKLRNTARQLEDALAQGMVKLQQTLVETLLAVEVQQMGRAVGKLADLADFVEKADHLRQQTLRNMHKILTPRQAARGLLALADYGQRLRALSELWAARPREPA